MNNEDLISRQAVLDLFGDIHPLDYNARAYVAQIKELPSAEKTTEVRPMQVELEADGYADGELVYDFGKCPKCGWKFEEDDKDWEEPYCCHCGQKLKWFETSDKTITETSMHHLICAMCDNDKCVRGTKECEFEKWKKKKETELKEEFEREIEIANKDIDLMPEQEDYMRGYLGGILCAYRIVFGKNYEEEENEHNSNSNNHSYLYYDHLPGTDRKETEMKYMMSIEEILSGGIIGERLFVGIGLTEQIVIETIREYLRTQQSVRLEIRVYEEVQKEEIK